MLFRAATTMTLEDLHIKRGESFDQLYQVVTANLQNFIRKGDTVPVAAREPIVQAWIDQFIVKYRDWILNERAYLTELYGYRSFGKYDKFQPMFTLCALAFLHISYDLPETISETLSDPQYAHHVASICTLADLKTIYNELEEPLKAAIRGKWKKPRMVRAMLLMKKAELEMIFMLWIITLRNRAWDDAVTLYCSSGQQANNSGPKNRLKRSVLGAMKTAKDKSSIYFYKRVLGLRVTESFLLLLHFALSYFTMSWYVGLGLVPVVIYLIILAEKDASIDLYENFMDNLTAEHNSENEKTINS